MLNFQVEFWPDCKDELIPLVPLHWKEVANNQDCIPLDLYLEEYKRLDDLGMLHIITARSEGKLIGYNIFVIKGHLHYKSSLTAHNDMYFLHPDYRKGFNGINFFKFSDLYLKNFGVQRVIMATKEKLNKGKIFERLGYKAVDIIYSKILN